MEMEAINKIPIGGIYSALVDATNASDEASVVGEGTLLLHDRPPRPMGPQAINTNHLP